MKYQTRPIPEPVRIKQGKGRPVTLSTAVLEGGRLIALFRSEYRAEAYAKRLNHLSDGLQ